MLFKKGYNIFKHRLWKKMTMLCINIMRGPLFQFLLNNYLNPLLLIQKSCSYSHFLLTKKDLCQLLYFLSFSPICKKFKLFKNNCLCFYCSCNCVSRWFSTIVENVMDFFNIIHSSKPMKKWNILKTIRKFYPILNTWNHINKWSKQRISNFQTKI